MGAGSFLASVARHSLRPVRQHSKLAAAAEVYDIALIDHERPTHVNHAQLAEQQSADGTALRLLNSFHVDLAERLQQLQLQGTGSAHLNWLLDALASTLSTHHSLHSALTATSAASAATIARQRADEVLSMLDVCSALKQVTHDINRQFGCLQDAVQSVRAQLNSAKPLSGGRLRAAARRMSACLVQDQPHTNILFITHKRYQPLAVARTSLALGAKRELQNATTPPHPAATLLSQALDGALLTSLLVLASAVSSLAPPSSRKSSGTITTACKMITKYLGGAKGLSAPWATPLRQLHRDLRQEDMNAAGGSLFQELQGLHCAAAKLHAAIAAPGVHPMELAGVKQSVESLHKRLGEAQACVATFHIQMASLFQALIALRLVLLGI